MKSIRTRIVGTFVVVICWLVFLILHLAFFAVNFDLLQNIAIFLASLLVTAVIIICGSKTLTRQQGRFGQDIFPHQRAFMLSTPLRRLILSPKEVVERLELSEASQVLELGPGPGYFSVDVARSVPKGHLLLIDLQREMLEKARRRLKRTKVRNVGYTQGDGSVLPLRDGEFDVAFLVTVLGEVHDQSSCLREIHRALRPKGLLSITEQPSDTHFIPLLKLRALVEGAGFHFERVVYGRLKIYTASFRKTW